LSLLIFCHIPDKQKKPHPCIYHPLTPLLGFRPSGFAEEKRRGKGGLSEGSYYIKKQGGDNPRPALFPNNAPVRWTPPLKIRGG